MSQVDKIKNDAYDFLFGLYSHSDDTSIQTLLKLVDSISYEVKEELKSMLGILSDSDEIEHVKIDVNVFIKKRSKEEPVKEESTESTDPDIQEEKAAFEVDDHNDGFIKVESSNIDSIGYNKEEKKLLVKFKQGTIYSYEDATEDDFKYITEAMSVGSAFDKFKRLHTRYSRLK